MVIISNHYVNLFFCFQNFNLKIGKQFLKLRKSRCIKNTISLTHIVICVFRSIDDNNPFYVSQNNEVYENQANEPLPRNFEEKKQQKINTVSSRL